MKNQILLLLCFLTLTFLRLEAQNTKTRIYSDTAQISILKVAPDSFPSLSLLFWAKNKWDYPVWGIKKEQVKILENGKKCDIISMEQITEKLPINLVIIIDHSGSMISDDYSTLTEYDVLFNRDRMKLYSPLANAKKAINTFLKNFNKPSDLAAIIGFSSSVDLITNFTNDKGVLSNQMNRLEEDGKTALYDAISIGLDSLTDKKGVNVIVALTDGDDNASTNSAQDIIKKSKELEIPIYIIGLGEIKKNLLESITNATNGNFYYTKKSTSLIEVYDNVAKQIKSIYEIKYVSENLNRNINNRDITMEFDIDTLFFNTCNLKYDLPSSYIQKKIKEEEQTNTYLWIAGISVITLTLGSLAYIKFIKKKTIV